MDPMLNAFLGESRDNLETANQCFLKLETNPSDAAVMDELFRAVHTIKGSSGLFDIVPFTKVVHAAEDILDSARMGQVTLTSEHIDLFLSTFDQITAWLDDLESHGELGAGANQTSTQLSKQLRSIMAGDEVAAGGVAISAPATEENQSRSAYHPTDNSAASEPAASMQLVQLPATFDDLTHEQREDAINECDDHQSLFWVRYQPDKEAFFSGEDPLLNVMNAPGLVSCFADQNAPWGPLSESDPFSCNLNFDLLCCASLASLQDHFRYNTDNIVLTPIHPMQLVLPVGDMGSGDSTLYQDFIAQSEDLIVEQNWGKLALSARALLNLTGPDLIQSSALRWLKRLAEDSLPGLPETVKPMFALALVDVLSSGCFEQSSLLDEIEKLWNQESASSPQDHSSAPVVTEPELPDAVNDSVQEPAYQQTTAAHLSKQVRMAIDIFNSQLRLLSLPDAKPKIGMLMAIGNVLKKLPNELSIDHQAVDAAVASCKQSGDKSELLLLCQKSKQAINQLIGTETTLSATSDNLENNELAIEQVIQEKAPNKESVAKVLKVDAERIDSMMNLVGELIVAKNALPYLARRAEHEFGLRDFAKDIKAQYAVFSRMSDSLQQSVLQIRMVPVSTVFSRFPRLVRDLSRKLDKKIQLVIEGEETEADKNIIEELSDPLIHLVRNSLDHGIELPSDRVAKGKPETGTIKLRASQKDDSVVIEVIDDGKGIDPNIIKRKAYEKGIIDEHRLDEITDHEAIQLIFAAGFSTAEQVSDLSGRGVGMDVVRTVVREAGGSVVAHSAPGEGSTMKLTLPLSMAISRIMMVEVNSQVYGVNMDIVLETCKVETHTLMKVKSRDTMVLRDTIVPLFYLRDMFNQPRLANDECCVLVVNINGQSTGIVVDDFHERLDIIQKPLTGVMASYPYYSGSALLGDGRVLLILNMETLLHAH